MEASDTVSRLMQRLEDAGVGTGKQAAVINQWRRRRQGEEASTIQRRQR